MDYQISLSTFCIAFEEEFSRAICADGMQMCMSCHSFYISLRSLQGEIVTRRKTAGKRQGIYRCHFAYAP